MEQLQNTDKVLWDSEDGMETVFVTKSGEGIGISIAGRTFVYKARMWVDNMEELDRYRFSLAEARARISKLESYITDKVLLEHGYKL